MDSAIASGAARDSLCRRERNRCVERAHRYPQPYEPTLRVRRVATRRYLALTLLLFTALTARMTFPQALHMRGAVHDDGDPLLNAWTLAWGAHHLPRSPVRVFDANIFFPSRWTLAFSETLLVPGLLSAPLRWLGAGPILVHNIVLLSVFTLSGVGTALLVRALTGSGGRRLAARLGSC